MIELQRKFEQLKNLNNSAILEVITPQTENAEVLKQYFKNFKNN